LRVKAPDPFISVSSCLVLYLGYLAFSYASLPAHMASHFNLQGHADGWLDRKTYLEIMAATGIFLPIVASLALLSATWLPRELVNLPNRDYWLADERRGSMSALLFRYALWFSSLNLLFFTGIAWLVVEANRPGTRNHLSGPCLIIFLAAFLVATGIWIHSLRKRFLRTS
jgi:uncharacterized membrane protein